MDTNKTLASTGITILGLSLPKLLVIILCLVAVAATVYGCYKFQKQLKAKFDELKARLNNKQEVK